MKRNDFLLLLVPVIVFLESFHLVFSGVHWQVNLFLFKSRPQDIQWYAYDTMKIVVGSLLVGALYQEIKWRGWKVRYIYLSLLLMTAKEILDYWFFANILSSWPEVVYFLILSPTLIAWPDEKAFNPWFLVLLYLITTLVWLLFLARL